MPGRLLRMRLRAAWRRHAPEPGPFPIKRREDRGEIMRPHIDHDTDPIGVLVRADLLQKRLDQLDRQVVTAVEADVFERRLHVALPRAGEAGDDDQVFGARHGFWQFIVSSRLGTFGSPS